MKSSHHLAVSALALSVAILSGCAGATRLPMRAKGPAGETLQTKQLDLSFLDAPGTQRQEVLTRLGTVDTSYSNPRLFWGRWSESKWGYWWVAAVTPAGGAGDAKRIWHIHNLLVSFDENGIVRKKALFNQDKSLWAELHSQLADAPPLDLTRPLQIEALGPAKIQTITLGKDSIQFDLQNAKVSSFQVSPKAIIRISHQRSDARFDPALTCHTLHLAEKGPLGKKISFCASPSNIATTFQYFQQNGSPHLRWE
jgi:hypothetical protein